MHNRIIGLALGLLLGPMLAGCNNQDERIEELEAKIERLESQRADDAAAPPTPTPTPAGLMPAPPTASPSPAASPAPAPDMAARAAASGNVCSDGAERHLTLINRDSRTIMYFYASPPSAGDWEEDVLGDEVVGTGERFRINFNSDERCTCVYDTKAVMDDEDEVIRKINVCTDHQQTYP